VTARRYLICQLCGWTAWTVVSMLYVQIGTEGLTVRAALSILLDSAVGFAISHGYRRMVRARRWQLLPLRYLAPRVLVAAMLQGALLDAIVVGLNALAWWSGYVQRIPTGIVVLFWFNSTIVFLAWSFLYFALHWLERGRRAEQAELRYLKSQLNPHFLFNALNGIRGLVAEDPAKAQQAITRLANLLRVALTSTTADTVPLARELEVVDDYLAVEALRLEGRLRVSLRIADDALTVPVPAMLVQTLVENGIKHGISRRLDGGELVISAERADDTLELRVSNTSAISDELHGSNLASARTGLANAMDRLHLLFGDKASLVLDRHDPAVTTARASIPIATPAREPR